MPGLLIGLADWYDVTPASLVSESMTTGFFAESISVGAAVRPSDGGTFSVSPTVRFIHRSAVPTDPARISCISVTYAGLGVRPFHSGFAVGAMNTTRPRPSVCSVIAGSLVVPSADR